MHFSDVTLLTAFWHLTLVGLVMDVNLAHGKSYSLEFAIHSIKQDILVKVNLHRKSYPINALY